MPAGFYIFECLPYPSISTIRILFFICEGVWTVFLAWVGSIEKYNNPMPFFSNLRVRIFVSIYFLTKYFKNMPKKQIPRGFMSVCLIRIRILTGLLNSQFCPLLSVWRHQWWIGYLISRVVIKQISLKQFVYIYI